MTFRAPEWLWLLTALPFVTLFLIVRERHRKRLSLRFVAERLRGVSNGLRFTRPWLFAAGLAGLTLALAGPRRGVMTIPIEEREFNRVLVLDVSNSMAAADVGTSRLDAAKGIARRIIEAQSGRTALIEFETTAEVVSPLTTDGEAVSAVLDTLQPGELTAPGSDIGNAVQSAIRLVAADPLQHADVIVISDGEDQGTRLASVAREAKAKGIAVSTVMVGSPRGSTIPIPGGGYLHDESGQVVVSYARADLLTELARVTGGSFLANPFSAHALDSLVQPFTAGKSRKKFVQVPVDRYQWPLALAFIVCLAGSVVHRGAD